MPVDPKLVRDLFLAVAELPEAERASYLQTHSKGDEELLAAVARLLAAHEQPASVLNQPAPGMPTVDFPGISERPGTMIGPYKLMEKIGEGGFGLVFVAEQTEPVKRKVALKVIKPGMDSKQVIARFEAERQALAMMDHPNIARVLDAGLSGEPGGVSPRRPYFVMELVRGIPITEYCDQNHLTPAERLELFVSVCHAIQHAHQKGIIHRDIKPSNVLVTSHDGKPVAKVIDFGIAKAIHQHLTERTIYTQFAQMIGTPLYMSPEQAEMSGLDIDTRSDIYSLGVLLYELLTGSTPLERKRLAQAAYDEIRRVIREEDPPRPSDRISTSDTLPSLAASRKTEPARLSRMLKGELDWIVMKALEKDRTRRYETANGFARDIQRYLSDEVVEARPASAGYRLRKFVRRNRGKVLAAGLVAMALVFGVVGTTWGLIEAKQQERLAMEAAVQERQAKQLAEDEKANALKAAVAEKAAKLDADTKRQEAERNLAFAKKGNDILGSVFTGLDPKSNYATVAELRNVLRDNLAKAVKELDGSAIGDPLEVAAMQNTLGHSLLGLGEANLAIEVLSKSFATRKERLGTEHPDTHTAMSYLAVGYQALGRMDQALPLLEETLKLSAAKLGADHPETLKAMGNLASGYRTVGKMDQALPLLKETLRLRTAKLGANHPDTHTAMHNLAVVYQALGRMDQALPLYEETLKFSTNKLGADHPDTLRTMGNLALCYKDVGKMDKALQLMEATLKLRIAKLGTDHPDTLSSMNNLALSYNAVGKMDKALPLYEETLKLRTAKLGAEHPDTLSSIKALAVCYWSLKQLDKSVPLFEALLPLREKMLGRQHLETLRTVADLGVNYKDAGRLGEAIPLLEEAYRAPKTRASFRYLSSPLLDAYAKAGKMASYTTLFQEQLADARQSLPQGSPQLASQLGQLGFGLLQLQKWTEAEPLLREALVIREKTQPDAWTTFNTQSMLGGALLGQKKYTEAEPLLLKGYEGMVTRLPKDPPGADATRLAQNNSLRTVMHTRLPEALDRLIQLYTETNKPDEVKKWQAEKAKLPAPSVTKP